MSGISTANSLQTVAIACATVAGNLNDPANEHPHVLKKITMQGQATFRFTTVIRIDGQDVEVQVRTVPPRT